MGDEEGAVVPNSERTEEVVKEEIKVGSIINSKVVIIQPNCRNSSCKWEKRKRKR